MAGMFEDLKSKPSDYQRLPDGRIIPSQQDFDTVAAESSGWDNFVAGMGAGMRAPYLGLKQRLGLDSPGEVEEFRRTENSLTGGAGLAGQMAGAGAAMAPAAMVPGGNTLVGSSLIGAATGALRPTAAGESPFQNTLFGVGMGAILPAATMAAKGITALAKPYFESGRKSIVGNMLRQFSSNADDAVRAADNAPTLVPGSRPSLAEATGDVGLATLQETARSASPDVKDKLLQLSRANTRARLDTLQKVGGTAAEKAAAEQARAQVAKQMYQEAFDAGFEAIDDATASKIMNLMDRPSVKSAVAVAKRMFKDDTGEELSDIGSVKGLHYLKLALDSKISDAAGNNTKRAILTQLKSELMDVMEKASPKYVQATRTFAEMSKPINRMEVGKRLYEGSTRALTEGTDAQRMYGDRFAQMLRNELKTVQGATGLKRSRGLRDVFGKDDIATLRNIEKDLAREAVTKDNARVLGSPTVQYLTGREVMRQVAGPTGLPSSLAESALADTLVSRPLSFLNRIPENNLMDLLGEALTNPQLGANLMRQRPPSSASIMFNSQPAQALRAGAGMAPLGLLPYFEQQNAP